MLSSLLILSALLNIVLIKLLYSISMLNKKLNDEKEALFKILRNLNQLQDENLEMYIRVLQQADQHYNQSQLF